MTKIDGGKIPEYILIKNDFTLNTWTPKEFERIFLFMMEENEKKIMLEEIY